MLNAIIVDDETKAVRGLTLLLKEHCPEVKVIDVANSADEAIKKIGNLKPDLVFLDISMPFGDGFSMLDKIGEITFEVIFTTAYSEHAIKAFKRNAIDYLLKPVKPAELINAVKKCSEKLSESAHLHKLQNQLSFLKRAMVIQKIPIYTEKEILLIDIEDIIRFEADRNYTNIHLDNGKKIVSAKPLADYDRTVPEGVFLRIHKKNLINRSHINTLKRKEGLIVMVDGSVLEISRLKKSSILAALTS